MPERHRRHAREAEGLVNFSSPAARLAAAMLVDALVVLGAFIIALLFRFGGRVPSNYWDSFWPFAVPSAVVFVALLFGSGAYRDVLRYTGVHEGVRVASATALATGVLLVADLGVETFWVRPVPLSVILGGSVLAYVLLVVVRLYPWVFSKRSLRKLGQRERALIVGAGEAGVELAWQLKRTPGANLTPVGFVDETDGQLQGGQIEGIPVLGRVEDIERLVEEQGIDQIFIALPEASSETMDLVWRECVKTKAEVKDKAQPLDVPLLTTIIQPSRGWVPVNLKDVLQFRELLYFLVWGELKGRYKQTVLGVAWAIIQPFVMMLVYTVAFGMIVRVPTEGVPYPVFVYSGLVVWTYFSNTLNQSSNSLLQYQGLITKVYFPRLLVPLASVAAGLIDFGIAFIVLIGLLKFYGYAITALVWTLPLFMLLAMTTALAVSLWLSALNVQYRDTGLLMPLLTQVWFFSTPIIYPSSLVPEQWRPLYDILNPMTIVVEGFRWALVGTEAPNQMLWVPVLIVAGLLVGGLYYFRRTERIFADVV
jgi:lipopolysaccharide transport system permease protein